MSPSAGTNSSRLFLNSQQFSDNIFDNPSCQSATVCMYVYSESVGQSCVSTNCCSDSMARNLVFIFLACIGTCSDCGTMYSNYLYIVSD